MFDMPSETSAYSGLKLKQLRWVWTALSLSVIVYIFVGAFASNTLQVSTPLPAVLVAILVLASTTATLFFLSKRNIPKVVAASWATCVKKNQGIAPEGQNDPAVKLEDFRRIAEARYAIFSMLSWAAAESVSVYGLMQTLLSSEVLWVSSFAGVSLALFAISFPHPRRLQDEVHIYFSKHRA